MFELDGQTAIVTGAAAGIGRAVAERFASAGACVAVADVNFPGAQDVASRIGHSSFAVQADVSNPALIREAVAEVLRRTGRIDILVNNAGIAGKAAPLWSSRRQTGSLRLRLI